jgi:SagB-type dehydrogenase family enzyme
MVKKKSAIIFRYHEQSKHHYESYAKSPGYMDWKNQPNPFRFYKGATTINLPFVRADPASPHMTLYRRQLRDPLPFTLGNVAALLELSMSLSAWKAYGQSRWSLRINPSSGNLHPTEVHLILPGINSIQAGVYHYTPLHHAVELRAAVPKPLWQKLRTHFQTNGFLLGLSSIIWREAWKYGERALRYCNHDVGHALAALSCAANLLGWKVSYLNGLSDKDIEQLLGFDRTEWEPLEFEEPDLLCYVHKQNTPSVVRTIPEEIIKAFSKLPLYGKPNRLSPQRVDWSIIYQTLQHCRKPRTAGKIYDYGARPFQEGSSSRLTASEIIRRRRSATAFDPSVSIDQHTFLAILDKTLPRNHCPPFDLGLGETSIHLLLFVHQVKSLSQGLYFFCRNKSDLTEFQNACLVDFMWEPVTPDLPLYRLKNGNFRNEATRMSCHQDIAGQSIFSLGMIARFAENVRSAPYRYRHLFWETGMIGQTLYLEAEAQGVRGTGIGCYFDDPVHALLGLRGNTWQSLYHFTIGSPIDDPRMSTLPPYHHLQRAPSTDEI